MLKKLSVALVSTMLLMSPALSRSEITIGPKGTKEAKEVCVPPKEFGVVMKDKGLVEVTRIEGEGLVKFKAAVAHTAQPLPDNVTSVVVYGVEEQERVLAIIFKNGCAAGLVATTKSLLKKLTTEQVPGAESL